MQARVYWETRGSTPVPTPSMDQVQMSPRLRSPGSKMTVGEPAPWHSRERLRPPGVVTAPAKSPGPAADCAEADGPPAASAASERTARASTSPAHPLPLRL